MSTKQFIEALHNGDYVFFLGWPQFITKSCLGDDCTQDADRTISLLTYEWMYYGFGENDVYHIAILHAVASEPNSVLKSSLSYAATTLAAAAMQCMVYLSKSIQAENITVCNLALNLIDPLENNVLLVAQDQELLRLSQKNSQAVLDARAKIALMLLLEEYVLVLDTHKNFNAALRMGLIISLCNYIRIQPRILLREVQEHIADCINKIRILNPEDREETFFLSRIHPLPLKDQGLILNTLWRGLNFFIKLEQPVLEADRQALTSQTVRLGNFDLTKR